NDSLTELNFIARDLNFKKENLNYQKQMLLNNKLLKGEGKSDSLIILKQAMEYYDIKLNEISEELVKLERKELKNNTFIQTLQIRLNDLNNYWNQQNALNQNTPIQEKIISVVAEQSVTAKVEVNYITYNAGWYATYDLKAIDVSKPIELTYKANIWQNTGINWKNVLITCSTGNPALGNNPPAIGTWYIGYYQSYYERDNLDDKLQASEMAESATSGSVDTYLNQKSADISSNYTAQNQTIANTEFAVNLKYSIPSDGKGHIVALKTATLKSDYNYLAIPKIDQSAYLIARITGWEELSLIPGNANIYFNSTYVGKTMLNAGGLSDTMEISLGRDKSVEVKRVVLKDKTNEKFLNSNVTLNRAFEISIRNSKAYNIDVIIKDHIPVSQVNEIKVEMLNKGGADIDIASGILTWKEKVKIKETKKLQFEFSVTYPKDTPITAL
ncbi:MAG TPA: DUF4139 domain-containing protein, partial [Chitinophagales bacterium]|nr:DUF4139 domain-containing protein [Chitinophagales bacterium]